MHLRDELGRDGDRDVQRDPAAGALASHRRPRPTRRLRKGKPTVNAKTGEIELEYEFPEAGEAEAFGEVTQGSSLVSVPAPPKRRGAVRGEALQEGAGAQGQSVREQRAGALREGDPGGPRGGRPEAAHQALREDPRGAEAAQDARRSRDARVHAGRHHRSPHRGEHGDAAHQEGCGSTAAPSASGKPVRMLAPRATLENVRPPCAWLRIAPCESGFMAGVQANRPCLNYPTPDADERPSMTAWPSAVPARGGRGRARSMARARLCGIASVAPAGTGRGGVRRRQRRQAPKSRRARCCRRPTTRRSRSVAQPDAGTRAAASLCGWCRRPRRRARRHIRSASSVGTRDQGRRAGRRRGRPAPAGPPRRLQPPRRSSDLTDGRDRRRLQRPERRSGPRRL